MPASLLECTIDIPKKVNCRSNKIIIKSTLVGNPDGVTYFWELIGEDSYIQAGQGTPRIIIHIGDSPVDVVLTLTDQYGCNAVCTAIIDCSANSPVFVRSTSNDDTIVSSSNSVIPDESLAFDHESFNLEDVKAWPNPTTGRMNMSIDAQQDGILQVGIYNLLGQEVRREEVNCHRGQNNWMIDLSDMRDGSYLIRISTGEKSFTKVIDLLR